MLPPCSRILILLLNGRHTLVPKSSSFDSFWRNTIFGAPWRKAYRIWSSPRKVRELGKIERRPPTEGIITFVIAYRQPPPPKQKMLKILFLSSKSFENWELGTKFQISSILAETSSILEYLFYSKTETTIQRPKGKKCEQYINKYWTYWTNCYYLKKLTLVEYNSPENLVN